MKWTLVVYFITVGVRQSAEVLGKDKIGWSSVTYDTYQQCSLRARMFNEDLEYRDKIKAACEKAKN